MGDGSKLAAVAFFCCCCYYCEQSDSNKLTTVIHFLLEVKKATIAFVAFFKCFVAKKATIASCHLLFVFFFFFFFSGAFATIIVNCSLELTINNDLMVFLNV
jgi:hypothetical protein